MRTPKPAAAPPQPMATVECPLCGARALYLGLHLREAHQLQPQDFQEKYPLAPLCDPKLEDAFAGQFQGTRQALKVGDLQIELAGYKMPINFDVPEEECLPIPEFYHLPQKGPQHESIRRSARALLGGRSVWAAGPPGTGKDAFFQYFCGITRQPSFILQIQPTADLDPLFFRQNFRRGELVYEEGRMTRALRDGYTTSSGRVIPYLILITDADRATPQQAEAFRLVTDSIQGRFQAPTGETYRVLPGTMIVMTANSTGAGDEKGQCISSNVIDASLLDRIMCFIQYVEMEWEDIEKILRPKFGKFSADPAANQMFEVVAKSTKALRRALAENNLSGTFTQRGLERWVRGCQDIMVHDRKALSLAVLKEGFMDWADGLPDAPNREVAYQAVKSFFDSPGSRTVPTNTGKLGA